MIWPPPVVCPLPMFDTVSDPRLPPPDEGCCWGCPNVDPPALGLSCAVPGGGLFVGGFVPNKPGLVPPGPDKPGFGVGMLIWASPGCTIFQSDSPVMGSLYFLRRKRMWLVSSSCSTDNG